MRLFLIKAILWSVLVPFPLLAHFQTIDLSDQRIPLEGANFYVQEVILSPDLPANIGFIDQGEQGCLPVFLSQETRPALQALFERSLPNEAGNPITIRVNRFRVSEKNGNNFFEVSLDFFVKQEHGYLLTHRSGTTKHLIAYYVAERVSNRTNNILQGLAACMQDYMDRQQGAQKPGNQRIFNATALRNQPATVDPKGFSWLVTSEFQPGIFRTFDDFRNGVVEPGYDVEMKRKKVDGSSTYHQVKFRDKHPEEDTYWGVTDGKRVFVKDRFLFLEIHWKDGRLITNWDTNVAVSYEHNLILTQRSIMLQSLVSRLQQRANNYQCAFIMVDPFTGKLRYEQRDNSRWGALKVTVKHDRKSKAEGPMTVSLLGETRTVPRGEQTHFQVPITKNPTQLSITLGSGEQMQHQITTENYLPITVTVRQSKKGQTSVTPNADYALFNCPSL